MTNKRPTGSGASNSRRQKTNEASGKGKSMGNETRTRNLSGKKEDKEGNRATKETKTESDGNGRSENTGSRTRRLSEKEEEEETDETLTKENHITDVKNNSKLRKPSQKDEDKGSNRILFSKESCKTDRNVRIYQRKDNKKPNKKSLAKGVSSRLAVAAVVIVPLVIVAVPLSVAVCAENLDCSAFYDSFKASVNVNLSNLSYIFDLITASANTGFCNSHKNENCEEFLLQKFSDLKLKYSDQSSDTWLTLFAAAHDHVSYQPDPQRPIVIMVYSLKDRSEVTEILEDVAEVYGSVLPPKKNYGNIIIEGKPFTNSSPEETQKEIQDVLEKGFDGAQKVAIVYDFDKLPSCSVLTFHNYCNNDDAPHKNVAIILTVTGTDEKLPSNPKSRDLEKAVSKLLHEKWKDCPKELPPGKIDAMLSRVANNVILLR